MFSELSDLSNDTIVALAVGIATLVIAIRFFTRTKPTWPCVPGSLPLFGNFLEVGTPLVLVNKLSEWADKYGQEQGVFQCNLMGTNYIVVCREDTTMQILSKRPYKVTRNKMLCSAINSVNATGAFSAEGQLWKADRRLVSPALNHKMVKDYLPSVKIVTERLVEKWTKLSAGGDSIATNRDCYQISMDITGLVILGSDFDTLRRTDSVDAGDVERAGETIIKRAFAPFPYWSIPGIGQYLDGGAWAIQRLYKSFEKVVKEAEERDDNATFVSKLVSMNKEDDSRMSRSRMIGNLMTMFVGGTDTSGSTLTTALWLLATDTSLQEDLATEARLITNPESITLDELIESLPRLRSFFLEVQRVYFAAPFLMFECAEEIPFLDTTLPKGSQVISMMRYTGMNPSSPPPGVKLGPNGEDVLEFCPQRWLVKDTSGKLTVELPETTRTAFLPFGHGLRMCPGRNFAESTFLFNMSSILRKFKFELKPNHPHVGRHMKFVEMPDRNVEIIFTLRD